jgi:hypothetical protein
MPFDQETRINKLEEIIASPENAVQTGHRITWQGETKTFDVYKIPIDILIYNKYNGRIGTLVKTWEAQHEDLNAENSDHIKIIEKFLWDSKKDRNNTTLKSIAAERQKIPGIVTRDGQIIDGNRRAMILNKIRSDQNTFNPRDHEHANYFNAIILDTDGTEKDIQRLETYYQMGQDEKLDYNPIEKYLKIQELEQNGFTTKEIAVLMNEPVGKVTEWSETMGYMEKYLDNFQYNNMYTMLEKREDQFLTLRKAMKSWNSGRGKADWEPSRTAKGTLENISFDYIRAKTEGKNFRLIGLKSHNGIFNYEKIWKKFANNHKSEIDPISDTQPTIEEERQNNPNADLTDVLNARDAAWYDKIKDNMSKFLGQAESEIRDKRDEDKPQELLERALNALESINENSPNFSADNTFIIELVKTLNKKTYQFKKQLGL